MRLTSISGSTTTFLLFQLCLFSNCHISSPGSSEYPHINEKDSIELASSPPREQCTSPPARQRQQHDQLLPVSPIRKTNRCGEIYKCSTGGIFYKPFEEVLPNERCIWTIFVPDARGYEVVIRHFGYVPKEQNRDDYGLILSEFGGRRKPTHFIPTDSSTKSFPSSSLLIVTFFTGPEANNQSGFILEYKALDDDIHTSRPVSNHSQHFLIGTEEYFHRYPSSGGYQPNVLSSLVFLPMNNIFREGKDNVIVWTNIGGTSSCSTGYLNVYILNVTCFGPDNWEFKGRICGSEYETGLVRSSEPILLIFESSYYAKAEEGKGFQFTYSTGL